MAFSFLAYLFFVLEIFTFLYYANMGKVMTSLVVPLKQHNIQSRITPEILKHCYSHFSTSNVHLKKTQNDTYYAVAMATLLVSFGRSPFVTFYKSGPEGLPWNTLGSHIVLTLPIRLEGVDILF